MSNTHALPAEYKCLKSNKTEQSILRMFAVSVLTTFSAPPQILAASTVFFCPIPETKKWWVMLFGATAASLFWTVNVCWAHPVMGQASSSITSWNFILLIFINVCQVRWIVIVFPINYVHSPDGELRGRGPGIIKTMHTGFSAYTYCIMPTPRCWHGRNRTLWFSVERFV